MYVEQCNIGSHINNGTIPRWIFKKADIYNKGSRKTGLNLIPM